MTVLELFNQCDIRSKLKVVSGYNSKVLCQNFNPERHVKLGSREVIGLWADISVINVGFGSYAQPIMYACVDGAEECEKEQRKKKESENDG